MKHLIISIFVLANFFTTAQEINRYGHLIKNEELKYPLIKQNNKDYFEIENGVFIEGNSIYKTSNYFITIVSIYENMPSWLYVYNLKGELKFQIKEEQIVNFKLSENNQFICYYNNKKIKTLNLENFKTSELTTLSTHFNIDNDGNLAYTSHDNYLCYKNVKIKLNELVNDFHFLKNQVYIVTRNNIYQITNKEVIEKIYTPSKGIIFETKIINNNLFYVLRNKEKGKFIFQLYSINSNNKIQETSLENNNTETKKQIQSIETLSSPHDSIPWIYHQTGNSGFPVGNSYGEIQDYGGSPYLHPGVDMLGAPQQEVYSVREGVVKAILTTGGANYWRMAIAYNNNTTETPGYLYAHLEQTSIPFIESDTINKDDMIGYIVTWPVADFHHCHFSRVKDEGLTWDGTWWTTNNVLPDITNQKDTTVPVFEYTRGVERFSFRDLNGNYQDPMLLHDSVRIISKFYDNINSNWNVDVCNIRYSLTDATTQQIIFDTASYSFDFPIDTYFANDYTHEVLYTIYNRDSSMDCHSVGNYDTRDFYHIVSNSLGNDTIKASDRFHLFNTSLYPDGNYNLKITASDCNGNTASNIMLINIKNNTGLNNNSDFLKIYPNPTKDKLNILLKGNQSSKYHIYNTLGQIVNNGILENSKTTLDLKSLNLTKGVYYIKTISNTSILEKTFIIE